MYLFEGCFTHLDKRTRSFQTFQRGVSLIRTSVRDLFRPFRGVFYSFGPAYEIFSDLSEGCFTHMDQRTRSFQTFQRGVSLIWTSVRDLFRPFRGVFHSFGPAYEIFSDLSEGCFTHMDQRTRSFQTFQRGVSLIRTSVRDLFSQTFQLGVSLIRTSVRDLFRPFRRVFHPFGQAYEIFLEQNDFCGFLWIFLENKINFCRSFTRFLGVTFYLFKPF